MNGMSGFPSIQSPRFNVFTNCIETNRKNNYGDGADSDHYEILMR